MNTGSRLKCGRGLSDFIACSRLPPLACVAATRWNWVKCRASADSAEDRSVPAAASRCNSRKCRPRIAATRRVDEILERNLGGIANDCRHVVMGDRALPAALSVERELRDLRAGHGLIGAETSHQIGLGLRIDAQARALQLRVDDAGEDRARPNSKAAPRRRAASRTACEARSQAEDCRPRRSAHCPTAPLAVAFRVGTSRRLPAVTRTTFTSANIGRVRSSMSSRAGSSAKSPSSRRRISASPA